MDIRIMRVSCPRAFQVNPGERLFPNSLAREASSMPSPTRKATMPVRAVGAYRSPVRGRVTTWFLLRMEGFEAETLPRWVRLPVESQFLRPQGSFRSEEHTSELQSLMRN